MRRILAAAVLSTISLAAPIAAPTVSALPPPAAPIHVLNAAEPCAQRSPDLAALGGGGFVATWMGGLENGAFGVGARLLDAEGVPLGGELDLSGDTEAVEQSRVAALADGGFAAAWSEFRPGAGPEYAILLRAFDGDGTPRGPAVPVASLAGWPLGLALAGDGLGRPAVAWSDGAAVRFRLFDADLTARSGIRTALAFDPGPGSGDLVGNASIAASAGGELLVVWEEGPNVIADPPLPWAFDRVRGRRFDPDGIARGPAFTIDAAVPGSRFTQSPAAAALAGGGWAVAWAWNPQPGSGPVGVYTRLLDDAGSAIGPAFLSADLALVATRDPDLAAIPDGGFALVWSGVSLPPPIIPPPFSDRSLVFLQRFDAAGTPLAGEAPAHPPTDRHHSTPAAAFGDGGRVVVVWRHHYPPPIILAPPCGEHATIEARAFDLGCVATAERLCLQGGRIAVEVLVDDPRLGPPRTASAKPLTDHTGTFWVFREENVEMAVKVLDGAGVNGFYWVFSGALSDLGYEIVVTDTLTGVDSRYENLPGVVASRADTRALPSPPAPPGNLTGPGRAAGTAPDALPGPADGAAGPVAAADGAVAAADGAVAAGGVPARALTGSGSQLPPPCAAGVLCLHGERFEVSIDWHDPRSGATGTATGVPLTDRSAYFWFFRPGNAEVVLKILDGRAVNGFFWVFFGGLTDLEYTVFVEDRFTELTWRYDNPPFTLTSHADTTALLEFPCPVCATGDGPASRIPEATRSPATGVSAMEAMGAE